MKKRSFKIGSFNAFANLLEIEYDSAALGWTLAALSFSAPKYKEMIVTVPGRDGDLDLSGYSGDVYYNDRTLTVRLENSTHNKAWRDAEISKIINAFDGKIKNFELPDDPDHYLTGRISCQVEYSNLAHAALIITARCDPWRYAKYVKMFELTATESEQSIFLPNGGRKAVSPPFSLGGSGTVSITVTINGTTIVLYQMTSHPDFLIPSGGTNLTYSGNGTLYFNYREAIL